MRKLAVLVILMLSALPVMGEVIIEKSSKTEFPAEISLKDDQGSSHELRAAGTGLRKKMIFKVYAACFYVDRQIDLTESPQKTAIAGDFAKKIVMHFLRDVGEDKIGGAFRDGIRKSLPEGSDEAVDLFVGFFTQKVMKGETIELDYLPGMGLSAQQAGIELGRIDDLDVIASIWATWFGDKPISDDLKRGLLGL